ncbi:type II toxin-antitoxin system prevent-host-death family antitoxin [Niveispirillum sp. KHB5.9]|uniref:type II toxin-antitoxin system prevent-host-death family antitoxin n=1 Tax=Niveispirillum sp. KHB5.9 TaxID=3400269 RepID=UPI003A8BC34C
MDRSWQIEEAQAQLADLVRRAQAGEPQVVGGQDGQEVVIVARSAYESGRRALARNPLLAGGPRAADDHDLEDAIAELREAGVGLMGPLPR